MMEMKSEQSRQEMNEMSMCGSSAMRGWLGSVVGCCLPYVWIGIIGKWCPPRGPAACQSNVV
jgi:hypothetical protein